MVYTLWVSQVDTWPELDEQGVALGRDGLHRYVSNFREKRRCFEEVLACPAEVLHQPHSDTQRAIDMVQRSDKPDIPTLYVPSIFGLLGLYLESGLQTLKFIAVVCYFKWKEASTSILGLLGSYFGTRVMEKKMETTIMGLYGSFPK